MRKPTFTFSQARCANLGCSKVLPYFSPSLVGRRRYCDAVCFANRHPATEAMTVLRLLGGSRVVADSLGLTRRAVRAWAQRGIPGRHHYAIMRLVTERGLDGQITHEQLDRTVADRRSSRRLELNKRRRRQHAASSTTLDQTTEAKTQER